MAAHQPGAMFADPGPKLFTCVKLGNCLGLLLGGRGWLATQKIPLALTDTRDCALTDIRAAAAMPTGRNM